MYQHEAESLFVIRTEVIDIPTTRSNHFWNLVSTEEGVWLYRLVVESRRGD